ncbi:MAG: MOSC domain-containing protein [Solirubrobacteraceae bacterium]|jgi:MOSC domain-containing protein YiiM
MGQLVSVNVGVPRQIGVSRRGRPVISAIAKSSVTGRIALRGVNLAGDDQADRSVHGGPDKAVYAYASEDAAWWATILGSELAPGAFGENLTTAGVEVSGAVIGERWRVGSTELEVCQPRQPCYKLAVAFDDPAMVRRFAQAGRPGAYLRITAEGELGRGDPVTIVSRPDHGITIAMVARAIMTDHGLLAHAARAPALPQSVAAWMRERADIAHETG